MAFGKIPRFSPSFPWREAAISAKEVLLPDRTDEKVRRFEHQFASYIGAKYAVMVPSARYGFYLLLRALGVGEGDEVIIPALTYYAIPAMAPLTGAKVVLADIGLNSHVLDPDAFEAAITERTKAVVPTHLFGTPCDMGRINEIAKKHGVKVIEDCAQSGGRFNGQRVGSFGDAAYYTFGLTKNITSLSGAMITTNDKAVAEFVRADIQQGDYAPLKKSLKEAMTGEVAMMVATHPKIYWATVHPMVVMGNKMGKDPIHERFGEPECRYDALPTYYQSHGKARAIQAKWV